MGLSDSLTTASDRLSPKDSRPEPYKRDIERQTVTNGAVEQYQKDFLDHVERNSAGYSSATFSPKDLANTLIQASNQLEGEAKDNLKRLMEFVVKDGQVLFVSSFEKPKDTNNLKTFSKFVSLLERSYPKLQLDYDFKLKRIKELKEEQRKKVIEDRKRVANGQLPINKDRLARIDKDLKEIGKELREMREKVFQPAVTAPTGPRNWGFTNGTSRRVVVIDRASEGDGNFNRAKQIDANLIARRMQETMDFRASHPKMTKEEQDQTHFMPGRFLGDLATNAYPYVYVHELGHQIHYRSGERVVPSDSVSAKRGFPNNNQGLSKYSNANYHERFAEAFSAFIFNPSALRQHDEPLYNWVKSSFEDALENAGVALPRF